MPALLRAQQRFRRADLRRPPAPTFCTLLVVDIEDERREAGAEDVRPAALRPTDYARCRTLKADGDHNLDAGSANASGCAGYDN